MKSITFGIGYLLAVLLVDVSSTNYPFLNIPTTPVDSPYNFSYFIDYNSLLVMEITLTNIPPTASTVTAILFTFDYSWSEPQTLTFDVNVDKKTREGKFMLLLSLARHQIWVAVLLQNGGVLCHETKITEGRDTTTYTGTYHWDTKQRKSLYYYYPSWKHDASGACLLPNACKIILDLKNTCKEQPKSTYGDNVECYIKESQYICKFLRAAMNFEELALYQTYKDNSVIGPMLEIDQQTTQLSIKLELELFDNNTSVKLAPRRLRINKNIWSDTLSITAQDISKASNVTILKYTDTTDVQFSCAQYMQRSTKIHVGFINTTDNTITTHNTTIMKRNNFKMADNGTILCCLFYKYQKYTKKEIITITRFVENKTLLIYQSHESTSINLTESNEQRKAPCQDEWWLYLLPTLLGIAILLLTLYIVKKQCWSTNSQPAEETVELENHTSTNQVLYANLDFIHNESRAVNRTEESPYANVIGVLHPL